MPNVPITSAVQGLPSLTSIKDPAVRMALQSMQQNWEVRNGNTGNTGERFVKANEIEGLAQDATMKLFGVTKGQPGVTAPPTGSNAQQLVDHLANAVAQSYLFQRLGQRIPLLSIPDKVFNQIDRVQSIMDTKFQSQIDRDSATNQRITTLAVKVDDAEAGISEEATVRAQKDMAIASSLARIWASIGGDPPNNDFSALIEDAQMATATPSAAQATRYTTLQSAVFDPVTGNNNIASLQQSFSTYVSAVDNKLNTLYTVQTTLSTGGQTVVGGFGLAGSVGGGTGPTIDFGVRADKFFIAATSSTPDGNTQVAQGSSIPFMVITSTQNVGGVIYNPGVYIKNATIGTAAIGTANIQDAAITTAKIGDAQINTAKIADATITNAKIQDLSVSTLKIQGDAVTVPRGGVNRSGSTSTADTVLISVSIPAGIPAVIVSAMLVVIAPNQARCYLTRNGTVVSDFLFGAPGVPTTTTPALGYFDTSQAAATYQLILGPSGGGSGEVQWNGAVLTCLGSKR